MESDVERARFEDARGRIPVEWIGEGLLLASLVVAPWVYGAVENSERYALCAVLLVASGLCLWPELRAGRIPRGVRIALSLPALALIQIVLRQTVAPFLTIEASVTAFAMAMAWAAIDVRAGASTHTSRRTALALLLVCGSESAFAAIQWSTDRTSLFGQKSEFQTMPFGSYVNHNNFAGLVSLGVPLAIAIAVGDLRRSGKLTPRGLAHLGLACGLAIAVLASGSRGGVVALTIGLVALAWISEDLRRKRAHEVRHRHWLAPFAIGAGVLILAGIAIPASTRDRLENLFDKSGSMTYRIDMSVASFHAFSSRPLLGSGLGAFADAAAPFKTGHGDVRSERAEADLVEFGVEGGLVLLIGLAWFGRFAWRTTYREMVHSRDRGGRWLRAGALASCITMLVHSLFDFGFRIPANALAFAMILGIATASSAASKEATPWRSRALIGLLAVLAVACSYRSVGAARERAALARTSAESRLDALQDVLGTHPYLDNARRQRGIAWMALAYSQGRYDPSRLQRARADFEAVVKMRPQWAEVRTELGWVDYYQGKVEEAKAEMQRATRLDPTHTGVGLAYAQVLAWSGQTRQAIDELSRIRRINPRWARQSALDLASSWTRDAALLASIP